MRGTDPYTAFSLVGSHDKATNKPAIKREEKPLLYSSLDAYPHHAFSATGRRNVCKRHGVTDPELETVLLAYTPPGEPTEAERCAADLAHPLGVIEAAVTPLRKSTARKGKAKKGGVRK